MKKFWKDWRNEFLIGFGILFLGIFLRSYNLTIIPVFGDEAIYIRWAQVMRADPTLRFLPLSDGKQPLFMWMVIPFLKVFSDPLFAGRIVSVITGLGTLIGIFVLTRLLFKSYRLSLIASFIYAISPFSIFFDRFALTDSMLSMFGVWALIFAVLTVRLVRLDTAMLTGFALGGALLTKTPATFFAALIPMTLILHEWPKKAKEKFTRASVFVFLFSFTYAIAYGMYNILRLGPNFHMIARRNKDYVYPLSHVFQSPLDPLKPFLDRVLEYFWILGPSFLVLLILMGAYLGLKEKRKETFVILSWGVLPVLVVAEFSKTMTARYIYFSVPYLFILGGLFLNAVRSEKVKSANLTHPKGGLGLHIRIFSVLLIFFVIHALYLDFQLLTDPQSVNLPRSERSGYLEEWTAGTGIKEVSEIIRREYQRNPQKKIVVGTEGYFGTLPDGLQIYLNDIPEITVIGVGVEIKELPLSLVESKKAGNKTFLVVNDSRLRKDPEDLGLELIAVYPKAFRKEGTKEYNILGPRDSLYLFELKDSSD